MTHTHSHGCTPTHSHAHGHCHGCGEEEEGLHLWQFVLTTVMLAAGIIAEHTTLPAPIADLWQGWGEAVWYIAAFLPVGLSVVREAVEHATEGDPFSEHTLMSVAAVGAFAIGEYPEAVAVMLLYQIGEALQDRAVDRARDNIRSLMALRPDHARLVATDGTVSDAAPEHIAVGQTIEVRPGERVALDGTLIGPAAAFDTAALTGEAQPRTIDTGSEVMAGMIASGSTVRLRVTRPAGESAVARILAMVEDASARKAPTELFMRRFAHIYTPAVMVIAVAVVVLPWLLSLATATIDYTFAAWFRRALVFLVISCPCALVISIPLGYFAGIGAASRRGILFKGGDSIDRLCRVDTVAFDKTGTLTTGEFTVTRTEGLTLDDLAAVATLESGSNHPIARAITAYAATKGITPATGADLHDIAGYGVESGEWLAGTLRLMHERHIDVPAAVAEADGTMVVVAHSGVYRGVILLGDTPKADARQALAALAPRRTEILSGDRQALTTRLAATVGASAGHGDLLPGGKADHVEALRGEGHTVAFVGDGINDAPALAASDVGIAMGALGSDTAVETADVVIADDAPSKVAEAIAIARRTRHIVAQNIGLSIGLKVLVMVLGLLGWANLWMAVFADSGVALLAVANSLRVFRHKAE